MISDQLTALRIVNKEMRSTSHRTCSQQYWYIMPLLLISSSSAVDIQQTIPENNSSVCPGDTLQYYCFCNDGAVGWVVGSTSHIFQVGIDAVNDSAYVNGFFLVLTGINGSVLNSTATYPIVSSVLDDQNIRCVGESEFRSLPINVADGPENCSSAVVMPVCHVTVIDGDVSKTQVWITLSNTTDLKCVFQYRIHFDEKIQTVSAGTSSTSFVIIPGEAILDGTIYTLDYENRTGPIPCTFTIPEPTGVKDITFVEQCSATSPNTIVILSWTQSVIGGCLKDDAQLEYFIDFNDTRFNSDVSNDANYELSDVPPGTNLEVTIMPSLPALMLSGPPSSTVLNIVKSKCVSVVQTTITTTFSSATPPNISISSSATASPTDHDSVDRITLIAVSVTISIVFIIVLLIALMYVSVAVILKVNQGGKLSGKVSYRSDHDCSDQNKHEMSD